ncbi:MAG: thiol reductant ABC exporter subunit CydC [Chloroflexota bacterium]
MRELRRLLQLLAPYRGRQALAVLLAAATVGAGIGLLGTAAWVIASAALRPSVADLAVAIVGVRFFGLARGLLRYLERQVAHDVTFRLLARLRVWFFATLEPLAPIALAGEHSGDLLARLVGDVETLQFFYLRALAPAAAALLVVALLGLGVGNLAPAAALALLGTLLAAGLLLPLLALWLGAAPGRRQSELRGRLAVAVVDLAQGLPDLLAAGAEGRRLADLGHLEAALAGARARLAAVGALQSGLGLFFNQAGAWAVLALGVPLVVAGQLDGVQLAVLLLVALASFEAVQPLGQAAQQMGASLASARRLFALEERLPEARPVATPLPTLAAPELLVEGLRLRYPGEARWALDGLSLYLRPGRLVALVGPSGAGKSTLLAALCGFLTYEEGHVRLGGHELCSVSVDDVRRHFAVAEQRAHLFNATLADNLRLARAGAGDDELAAVLRAVGLAEFVAALPAGRETWLGEAGVRLSGGERQRLALARALLKEAPLLLLDEPTAHLDANSERLVLAALRQAARQRGVLLATHRLVGLAMADEIVVLGGGRVLERGSEAQLLAQDGAYRRLYQAQREALAGEV